MPRVIGTGPNGGTMIETDDGRIIETAVGAGRSMLMGPTKSEAGPATGPLPAVPPEQPKSVPTPAAPPPLAGYTQNDFRNDVNLINSVANGGAIGAGIEALRQRRGGRELLDAPPPKTESAPRPFVSAPSGGPAPADAAPTGPTMPEAITPMFRPASGGKVIPAHEEARGRTLQTEQGLDLPDVPAALAGAREAESEAAMHARDLERDKAAAEQTRRYELEMARRKQEEQDAEIKTERDRVLGETNKEIESAKVDPSKAFVGGSFGQALAAIAAGVGAYASTITGQPNTALQIMNTAIDRSIDLQLKEINKKKDDRAEMLAQWGSEDEWRAGQRASKRAALMQQMDTYAEKTTMDSAQSANAAKLRAEQERQFANDQIELAKLTQDRVTQSQQFAQVQQQTVGGSAGGLVNGAGVVGNVYAREKARLDALGDPQSHEKASAAAAEIARGMGATKQQVAVGLYNMAGGDGNAPVARGESKEQRDERRAVQTEARSISDSLRTAKVPEFMSTLTDVERLAQRESIPGFGPVTTPAVNATGALGALALSEEGRANRGAIQRLTSSYTNMVTGAGGNEAEMQRHVAAVQGARTPEELRAAVAGLKRSASAQIQNVMAGASPEARAAYLRDAPAPIREATKEGEAARSRARADAAVRPVGEPAK